MAAGLVNRGSSVDHLVGARKQSRRNVHVQPLGREEVDDHLVTGRQLYRQVPGPRPFQDRIDVGRCSPKLIGRVDAVGDKTAAAGEIRVAVDARELVAGRQCDDEIATPEGQGVRRHDQCSVRATLGEAGDQAIDLVDIADRDARELQSEPRRRFMRGMPELYMRRRRWVIDEADALCPGCNVSENFQPFAAYRFLKVGETRKIPTRPLQRHRVFAADRIADENEDDRNRLRLLYRDGHDLIRARDDHVGLQDDELLKEGTGFVGIDTGPTEVDPEIARLFEPDPP